MAEVFFLVGATEKIKKELSGEAAKASREAARKKPLVPTARHNFSMTSMIASMSNQ